MDLMNNDLFNPGDGTEAVQAPPRNEHPASSPLAERMRPRILDDFVGQEDLIGPDRPLRTLVETDNLPSLLFWGPPGCGKTSLARVIATRTDAHFLEYSAVQIGSRELKAVMAEAQKYRRAMDRRTIIFLDEIHRFNKAQQDALLPWVERGDVVLIGATTENPSFEINSALLSRTRLFVLEPLTEDHLIVIMERALVAEHGLAGRTPRFESDALAALAAMADGDARTALNLLDLAAAASGADPESAPVDAERIATMVRDRALRYDRAGEEHFNLISALHKSLRNSDPDAAVYYLARMLEAGEDPLYIARRLVRMASEDVGLADPMALPQALAARDAVHFVGMPEGALALAQAAVYLALAPKSNALYCGYSAAAAEVRDGTNPQVPAQLRNAPTRLLKKLGYGKGYLYAHDNAEGVAAMECLPAKLAGRRFYEPTHRGHEVRLADRLDKIRAWREQQLTSSAGDKNKEQK